ncbi:hypothetical protein IVB14_30695 [Bradyrhizobium sp. 180]|uniref:hypothetical protein n=1 Tax=Bradyrhizobium sp. 180 TaxID=2782650 RepID=UPI001FFA16C7|nr:hypothetical protein [Bradyrhizobium sp. 180]MCK1494664.1 hypothetical protein [Bradyrhizobium sp. 180]
MNARYVKDLLTQDEFDVLSKAPSIAGARHPTWFSVFYEKPRRIEFLTNEAVARVSESGHSGWLEQLKPRLLRLDDHEEAAAALAELRAFGAMLEAGFTVEPIPRSNSATPDFTIDAGDGPVVVEVFTKHEDDDQKQLRELAQSGGSDPNIARSSFEAGGLSVKMTATVMQPGGAPDPNKPHDSVQANLISRICAAKGNETQLSEDRPSLLWMDLRSFGLWPEIVEPAQSAPLMMSREGLVAGALWYGLYGWKGAPIFDPSLRKGENVVPMGHDGRFRLSGKKKSKLSGVIVTLPETSIFFENPWATSPIGQRTRHQLVWLPDYDLPRSVCSWSDGDALASAELGRRQIEAMEKHGI